MNKVNTILTWFALLGIGALIMFFCGMSYQKCQDQSQFLLTSKVAYFHGHTDATMCINPDSLKWIEYHLIDSTVKVLAPLGSELRELKKMQAKNRYGNQFGNIYIE
jgi:hypothetical protein